MTEVCSGIVESLHTGHILGRPFACFRDYYHGDWPIL